MAKIVEVIEKIQSDILQSLKDEAKVLPHTSNWASVLPDECLRQQVYYRLDWEKQLPPNPYLQGVYNTGKMVEDMTILTLNQIGIRATPKWELLKMPDRINDTVLRECQIGSVTDVFLVVRNGDSKPTNLGPVEIKSVDPNIYRGINCLEDFNKYWWMKRYPGQLTTYMFGSNFEQGAFLLVNKTNWWDYKIFPYYLDVSYMDELLARAKAVNEHVELRLYPDRTADRTLCQHCDFKHICLPDEDSESIELTDNAELLELLEERDRLHEASKEYEQVNDKLKEIWKITKPGTYLVGGTYQVKLSTYQRTFYNVPPEIKDKYKDATEHVKATITKVKD